MGIVGSMNKDALTVNRQHPSLVRHQVPVCPGLAHSGGFNPGHGHLSRSRSVGVSVSACLTASCVLDGPEISTHRLLCEVS